MTFPGGITANATNAARPRGITQHMREMLRMRAVHHKIGGCRVRRLIDRVNSLAQGLSRGQPAIRLYRKRHDHREAGTAGGQHQAARLSGLREGQRGDHVDFGVGEPTDLLRVIALGFMDGNGRVGRVGIPLRANAAIEDNELLLRRTLVPELHHQGDRRPVRLVQLSGTRP